MIWYVISSVITKYKLTQNISIWFRNIIDSFVQNKGGLFFSSFTVMNSKYSCLSDTS